ncbi:uncharacterized protein RHIMIDRAFT_259331 [Rhizopus microsporus ATCC 52813]|uniref:Uncharacterized protein n=2 Tax=Rhizopus microsporus TaxID=58291 RepID=A0A2G4SPC5_RHIZD|nr:uncharacterized protein RHIMIDRAFT_259331 [Rhizopus microsporus ATCC 52813]PHZ10621.1 hypothetical protein RHIMIDRAFT_259331 [Rhizopus microsporus ATCC 52813]
MSKTVDNDNLLMSSMTNLETNKKKKSKKKKSKKYRVECHRCHDSFETTEKVVDRYTCQKCQSKPALIILPLKKTTMPNLSSLSLQEDDEDICPVCDTDCTCGTSAAMEPAADKPKEDDVVERVGITMKKKQKKRSKKKKKHTQDKIVTNVIQRIKEGDEDEDVIVDDLDDLLDSMSPLSNQESEHEIIDEKELFTDESEPIDSDDDEDIEAAETQAIIEDMTLNTDEDSNSDSEEIMYIEDEDLDDNEDEEEEEEDKYETRVSSWSSSDDEEDEDEFSFSEQETSQTMENENIYDNIVSAFMHALAPNDPGGAESTGANTPIASEGEQLSAFELANALSLISSLESTKQMDILRRPSLPSSTVSAAQRHRGSQDITSEALRTLSTIISDDLSLSFDTTHASSSSTSSSSSSHIDTTSLHIQEQLFDFIKQSITPVTIDNKKRHSKSDETNDQHKKRRLSQAGGAEEAQEVSMDDLVDVSQLHSDDESNDQDHPYSKDLSRWERIPIGAFRLMRSKNKLWLER